MIYLRIHPKGVCARHVALLAPSVASNKEYYDSDEKGNDGNPDSGQGKKKIVYEFINRQKEFCFNKQRIIESQCN